MDLRRPLDRLVAFATARPVRTLAVVLVLALGGGLFALGLTPSSGVTTLVGGGSESAKATKDYHESFGDEAVIVLVKGDLPKLVDTADLGTLIKLEGCLGGNVPRGATPYGKKGGPCWDLARLKPARVVYGPGTFLFEATNEVSNQLQTRLAQGSAQVRAAQVKARADAQKAGASKADQDRAAKAAGTAVQQNFVTQLAQLAVQTGIQGLPRLDNPQFINQIVFDPSRGAYVPKSRFAYLFPSKNAALVQVRLKPGLSDTQRTRAVALIRDAVKLPTFKLGHGGRYTVTGVPTVVDDLAGEVGGALGVLFGAALLVMGLTLLLAFRGRPRLLPLGVALAAAGLVFGAMRLLGGTVTMATVAVLPVLIGLAVDYAVQFQSRVEEAGGDVRRAARAGGPTILAAGLATAVGFLVLLLSPVPMVRGFGLVLVAGVLVALVVTFTAGAAALTVAGPRPPGQLERSFAAARRGALDLLAGLPGVGRARAGAGRAGGRLFGLALRRPGRVLAVGLVLALAGWVADTQSRVESDVTKLVPQSLTSLQDIKQLQRSTGISGEVDVVVEAKDITDPRVVKWMTTYQDGVLKHFGYTSKKDCGESTLCPALSLTDLFATGQAPADATQVRRLLAAVPRYFSRAAVTPDRKRATLAFGIRLMPLDRQQRVIDTMRSRLKPPPGVTARMAGLPVLAAEANDRLSSPWRRLGTLVLGLLAVGLALWAVFRRLDRALIPLVPIALATGWAGLVAAPVELNPMSVTLGTLVIAIATEFSVLLSERFRQERAGGLDTERALRRAYASTGAAVVTSGVTAIAGFAVLAISHIAMVRNFGWVTVLDLAVALGGVLLVLPAVIVLAERGGVRVNLPARLRRRPRGRRDATVA